jgi:hypothetical protein
MDEMTISSEMRIAALLEKWQARYLGDRALRDEMEEGEDGLYQGEKELEAGYGPEDAGEDIEGQPEAEEPGRDDLTSG